LIGLDGIAFGQAVKFFERIGERLEAIDFCLRKDFPVGGGDVTDVCTNIEDYQIFSAAEQGFLDIKGFLEVIGVFSGFVPCSDNASDAHKSCDGFGRICIQVSYITFLSIERPFQQDIKQAELMVFIILACI
jgi:hypothetical protein